MSWKEFKTHYFYMWIYKISEKGAYLQNTLVGPYKRVYVMIGYTSKGSCVAMFIQMTWKLCNETQMFTNKPTDRLLTSIYSNPYFHLLVV